MALLFAAILLQMPVRADEASAGDGKGVSAEELADDLNYGGYPNNRFFNNSTSCDAAVHVFFMESGSDRDKLMERFSAYAKPSLILYDSNLSRGMKTKKLIDMVPRKLFDRMVDLYRDECVSHKEANLNTATTLVYLAFRLAYVQKKYGFLDIL